MKQRGWLMAVLALVVTAVSLAGSGRTATAASTPDPGGPYSAVVGEPIAMSAVNSLNAVAWRWDFGDGTSAEGMRVTKTYAFPGTYFVTLTTTDPSGGLTSASSLVTIRSNPHITSFLPFACTWVIINGVITCHPGVVVVP